jgi:hypothetical protein
MIGCTGLGGHRLTIKQIAVAMDGEGNEVLYALTEAGVLFEKKGEYTRSTADRDGYCTYWWEEFNLPVGDPRKATP